MSAYVILDIDVHDPTGYQEYAKLAPAAVTLYSGRQLVQEIQFTECWIIVNLFQTRMV